MELRLTPQPVLSQREEEHLIWAAQYHLPDENGAVRCDLFLRNGTHLEGQCDTSTGDDADITRCRQEAYRQARARMREMDDAVLLDMLQRSWS